MSGTLDPAAVARRLDELRRLYVPETRDEARARMERDRPNERRPASTGADFAKAVARRLEELRALCELTRVLHAARERK